MRINRRFLYWGAFLAALGGVLVAADLRNGDTAVIADALRFWPLAFVAIGLGLVLRRTRFSLPAGLLAAAVPGLVLGGSFAPNFSHQPATTNDPKSVVLDPWCYAFRFLKLAPGSVAKTDSHPIPPSQIVESGPLFYPDGIVFSQAEIRHQLPDTQTLLENMKNNHWDFVVKTRLGYFRPFGQKDQVFATPVSPQKARSDPSDDLLVARSLPKPLFD